MFGRASTSGAAEFQELKHKLQHTYVATIPHAKAEPRNLKIARNNLKQQTEDTDNTTVAAVCDIMVRFLFNLGWCFVGWVVRFVSEV